MTTSVEEWLVVTVATTPGTSEAVMLSAAEVGELPITLMAAIVNEYVSP
jgi:hypothetical protein